MEVAVESGALRAPAGLQQEELATRLGQGINIRSAQLPLFIDDKATMRVCEKDAPNSCRPEWPEAVEHGSWPVYILES